MYFSRTMQNQSRSFTYREHLVHHKTKNTSKTTTWWIKYWLMWFERLLVFILFKFKKRCNISKFWLYYDTFNGACLTFWSLTAPISIQFPFMEKSQNILQNLSCSTEERKSYRTCLKQHKGEHSTWWQNVFLYNFKMKYCLQTSTNLY